MSSPDPVEDVARPSQLLRLDAEALAPFVFGILFLGTIIALGYVLSAYIPDLVLAFVLVGMFRRTYERLRSWLGDRAFLASGLTTLLAVAVIVAPIVALGWTVIAQATTTYGHLSELLGEPSATPSDALLHRVERLGLPLTREHLVDAIQVLSTQIRGAVIESGGAVVEDTLALLVHLATTLVIVFYLLVDGHRLRRWVYELSPLPDEEDALLEQTFKNVARGVVWGNGLGSALQGLIGGFAMWVAGFPAPVLWGAVMSIFAFLPLVGIAVVTVPATAILLLQGRTVAAIAFFGFCTAQGLVIENVVKTRLMGSAMRMHDLLVFLSVLGGIGAFGLIGLIYGPLCAMLFLTLSELYLKHYRPQLARKLAGASLRRAPPGKNAGPVT